MNSEDSYRQESPRDTLLINSIFPKPIWVRYLYKLTQLTNDYWHTMYVLYACAVVSFGSSYLAFKTRKKALGNTLLAIGMFLNPFGYDLVVYGITTLTHSYWRTMGIMYMMTGAFFGGFLFLYRINPIKAFKQYAKATHLKAISKLKRNG
jgi:hypothetical protein